MRWGTCYFVSKSAAIRYFNIYDVAKEEVALKIKNGEIHIGKPTLKPGETLHIIDNGTRYAIESEV